MITEDSNTSIELIHSSRATIGQEKYKRIELLEWNNEELDCGKIIKIKGFPAKTKVKLFRVTRISHKA